MRYFILLTVLTLSLFSLAPQSAQAAMPKGQYTPSIVKVENYLRGITTIKARFLQTSAYGELIGTFYLDRPGKLRFEYDPPVKDFVVADGVFIYFYDSELGEQTNAPIGQTMADFLLRNNLRLSGDIHVTDVSRHDGLLHVTLVQTSDPDAGSLTLSFAENPNLELKKWMVMDATGATTAIELFDIQRDIDIPRKTFTYRDPDRGLESYNE